MVIYVGLITVVVVICAICFNFMIKKSSEEVAAEAYQVIGVLADEAGVFETDEVQYALDYFSALSRGETPKTKILPFGLNTKNDN